MKCHAVNCEGGSSVLTRTKTIWKHGRGRHQAVPGDKGTSTGLQLSTRMMLSVDSVWQLYATAWMLCLVNKSR